MRAAVWMLRWRAQGLTSSSGRAQQVIYLSCVEGDSSRVTNVRELATQVLSQRGSLLVWEQTRPVPSKVMTTSHSCIRLAVTLPVICLSIMIQLPGTQLSR